MNKDKRRENRRKAQESRYGVKHVRSRRETAAPTMSRSADPNCLFLDTLNPLDDVNYLITTIIELGEDAFQNKLKCNSEEGKAVQKLDQYCNRLYEGLKKMGGKTVA